MAKLLKGAEVVSALNERIMADASALRKQGAVPTLAVVRVGERADDVAYERSVMKRAETVGVEVRLFHMPESVTQSELLTLLHWTTEEKSIHGCLVFRPLPRHIDDERVRAAISPEKDVDGITDGSLAGVFSGTKRGFPPCTAQACMEILDYYGVETKGKTAVVIGRSLVVGKPVSMMLLQQNATVTICHTKTLDLPSVAKRADILVAAAGRAGVVGAEYVSKGQTVLDVGINFTPEGKMTGDVDFDAVEPVAGAITPVPGGVGTVTTSVLLSHVVEAAKRTLIKDSYVTPAEEDG